MFSKKDQKRMEDRDGQRATVIAPNTKFEGTISGQDTIRIAGNFEGEITCENMLWVEKGGKMNVSRSDYYNSDFKLDTFNPWHPVFFRRCKGCKYAQMGKELPRVEKKG